MLSKKQPLLSSIILIAGASRSQRSGILMFPWFLLMAQSLYLIVLGFVEMRAWKRRDSDPSSRKSLKRRSYETLPKNCLKGFIIIIITMSISMTPLPSATIRNESMLAEHKPSSAANHPKIQLFMLCHTSITILVSYSRSNDTKTVPNFEPRYVCCC